jgi:hypothetical protein
VTPVEATARAAASDLEDTLEIIDQWVRRMTDRQAYRADRVRARASRELCADRGHTHGGFRGCPGCRADIARVMP